MRSRWLVVALLVAGCGENDAPFDELPLRDALRADPEVIASLPEGARLRLGARLEAARASDETIDAIAGSVTWPVQTVVVALDKARERRQAEPLMVGLVGGDGQSRPLRQLALQDGTRLVLAHDEGAPAAATLEARALDGQAGAAVKTLLRASGAREVRRVVGWPIGAVAVGDTVYVNAAWLVATAAGSGADAGLDGAGPIGGGPVGGGPSSSAASAAAAAGVRGVPAAAPDGGVPPGDDGVRVSALTGWDGGADIPPAPPPPTETEDECATACGEACTACAESSSSDTSATCTTSDDDSCEDTGDDSSDDCSDTSGDESAEDCSESGDDSADACASTGDESADCGSSGGESAECAVGNRRRPRKGPGSHPSLLAPLAYLLLRRRP